MSFTTVKGRHYIVIVGSGQYSSISGCTKLYTSGQMVIGYNGGTQYALLTLVEATGTKITITRTSTEQGTYAYVLPE